MPSEKTPLNNKKTKSGSTTTNAGAGSSSSKDVSQASNQVAKLTFSNLAKEAMSTENLEQVSRVAAERVEEMGKSLMAGNTSLRVLACLGGIAIVLFAGVSIITALFHLDVTKIIMGIYALAFGAAMILMEGQFIKLPKDSSVLDRLFKYCLFLKFIWGRGALYLITGTLQAAQGGLINFIVGAYVMLVGILYIWVGRSSAKILSEMKHSIFSEGTLKAKFQKYDKDQSGAISLEEFGELIHSLDLDMTKREKEAIFFHLDINDNEKLEYDEFVKWWQSFDASSSV